MEEKAKQLEQVASLSALIAGFALVAMVEVNIPRKGWGVQMSSTTALWCWWWNWS